MTNKYCKNTISVTMEDNLHKVKIHNMGIYLE